MSSPLLPFLFPHLPFVDFMYDTVKNEAQNILAHDGLSYEE